MVVRTEALEGGAVQLLLSRRIGDGDNQTGALLERLAVEIDGSVLGAGVVTTRNHIHWFVTEHGAVDLYGKTLQERARLIISVADPSAQEELDKAAFERFGTHHHYIKGYMTK